MKFLCEIQIEPARGSGEGAGGRRALHPRHHEADRPPPRPPLRGPQRSAPRSPYSYRLKVRCRHAKLIGFEMIALKRNPLVSLFLCIWRNFVANFTY